MIPQEIQKDTVALVFILSFTLYPTIVFSFVAFTKNDLKDYPIPFYAAILIGIFLDLLTLLAFINFAYFCESIDNLRRYINYLLNFHFLYCIFPSGLIFTQVIIPSLSNQLLFTFGLFYIVYNVSMLFVRMFMGHLQRPYWLCN